MGLFADYLALTVGAVLPVLNPVGSSLIFLGMVGTAPRKVFSMLARRVAFATFLFLVATDVAGAAVLRTFGISLPVVQLGGGIVIAAMGWELLNKKDVQGQQDASPHMADIRRAARNDLLSLHVSHHRRTGRDGGDADAQRSCLKGSAARYAVRAIGRAGGDGAAEPFGLCLLRLCAGHHGQNLRIHGARHPARGFIHPVLHRRADCVERAERADGRRALSCAVSGVRLSVSLPVFPSHHRRGRLRRARRRPA